MKTIRQYCYERGITLRKFCSEQERCQNWAANLQYKGAMVDGDKIISSGGRLLHEIKLKK